MSVSFQEEREGKMSVFPSQYLVWPEGKASQPCAIKRWYNLGKRGLQIRETYI